ncbi:IS3 family transposase [Paenibacillus polymyxa]|uniref:IS3 family transposase n=1 Tax=Paenibacillus polymyxa TaxID=1406 RepID=UPI0035E3F478
MYGSQKVNKALVQQGVTVSEKTVVRIMKELGLKSKTAKEIQSNHELQTSAAC